MISVCASGFRLPLRIAVIHLLLFPLCVTTPTSMAMEGQERPKAEISPTPPKIESNQVRLNVSLRGRRKHQDDLQAADVSVVDAGQPIDHRELVITANAGEDKLVTLLFDRLTPGNAKSAQGIADKIVKEILTQHSVVGVWAIDSRTRLLQSYTSDRNLIDDAIKLAASNKVPVAPLNPQATAAVSTSSFLAPDESASSNLKLRNQTLEQSVGLADRIVSERHVPWGPATLMAAALSQRVLPGRKAIVYFTDVQPADVNAVDMFRTVSHQLRDSSITLFVVDMNAVDDNVVNGMQAASALGAKQATNQASALAGRGSRDPGASTMGMTAPSFRAMSDTITSIEFDSLSANKNLLAVLAQSTEGTFTNAGTETKRIARDLLEDLGSYYTISYPVPAARRDGKFHDVVIRLAEKGAKTEEFAGYFANPESSSAASALSSHLNAPGPPNDLTRLSADPSGEGLDFNSSILSFGSSANASHRVFAIELPIKLLDLQEDANTDLYSLHASVAAEIRNASGALVAHFHEEFHRHGAIDNEAAARAQALSVERSVDLVPGDYSLEGVVRDWNTGKIGNVHKTIHVDDQKSEPLSDVVAVRSTLKLDSKTSAGALSYGTIRVIPDISTEVTGRQTVQLYFQQYLKAAESEHASMRVEVAKDGKIVDTLPIAATHPHEGNAYMVRVPLDHGAGRYNLTVSLEYGGQTTQRGVSLDEIEPAPTASSNTSAGTASPLEASLPLINAGLKDAGTKALSTQESTALIEGARERALSYGASLPNFICVERIDRSNDRKGTGVWKHKDSIVEILRYQDKVEKRSLLELNGEKSSLPLDHLEGTHSNGEFGIILKTVFDPEAKAEFTWQRSEDLDADLLQVYSFKVDAAHSQFFVTDRTGMQVRAPFHGLVFVDNSTRSVRRVLAEADDLPPTLQTRSTWMAVNYDYIAINRHDYLLPTRGEVGIKQGKHEVVLNQLRFSDYRRFGSRSRIVEAGATQK